MFARSIRSFTPLLSRCCGSLKPKSLCTTPSSTQRARCIHTAVKLLQDKESKSEEFERLVTRMKRPVPRKRRPLTANLSKTARESSVVSIALSESFDLHGIAHDTSINDLFNVSYIDEEFDNALHLVKKLEYTVRPTELSEIFVFEDGVVVFWNVESAQRVQLLRDLERFTSSPYESRIAMDEQDRMPFSITDEPTNLKHDRFYLSDLRHGTSHRAFDAILERFALSQGFAASVKIGVWESLLNDLAEPLSETTKSLKEGVIPWNRKQALVRSGEFAALRHSINLDCNLLNRDFYWERSEIEQYYVMTERHFTLHRRLSQLNSRLDYCEELVKMVDNMLALRHASFLEWLIIVLIVIEVFFDVFHFVDRKSPHPVYMVQDPAIAAIEAEATKSE